MSQAAVPDPTVATMAQRLSRPSRLWFWLAFSSVIATFAFVLVCAVNVPYWDDWEWVRLLQSVDRGQWTIHDLLSHHNEHRIVVPRLVALALAWPLSFDTVAECLFTVGHLTVLVGYAYAAARRSFGFAIGTAPAWFVTVPWLLLSWRQAENLLWGFQIGLSLPLTFTFASLWHIESYLLSRRPVSLALSMAAATAGSFSSAMGLLVWPAALVVLWLRGRGFRAIPRLTAAWIVVGASVWLSYFTGYTAPPHHAPLSGAFRAPDEVALFFLRLCGAWATHSQQAVVGSVLLGLLAACVLRLERRRALTDHAVWLAFATFCSLTLALIAAGRWWQPWSSDRSGYTTYSLPLAATLVVLLAATARGASGRVGRIVAAVLASVVAGTVLSNWIGANIGDGEREAHRALQTLLLDYPNRTDAELTALHPVGSRVREGADFLAARRWSVFAHDGPAGVPREPRQR